MQERLCEGERIAGFGRETLEGVCKYRFSREGSCRTASETVLFDDDKSIVISPVEEIAISSTGHVAVITNGAPPLSLCPFLNVRKTNLLAGQVLQLYTSISSLHSPSKDTKPLLRLSFPTNPPDQPPSSKFSSLSAGDAHFAFIVSHERTNCTATPGIIEPYYNKIWSIRTDKRSLNDEAWIPLVEELESLAQEAELEEFIQIGGTDVLNTTLRGSPSSSSIAETTSHKDEQSMGLNPTSSRQEVELEMQTLALFVAGSISWDVEFTQTHSKGWLTLALSPRPQSPHPTAQHNPPSTPRKAYLFPFGKAASTIPGLQIGEIIPFTGIVGASCGSEHVVVVLDNGEVWSFGNDGFGQRGIGGGEGHGVVDEWRKVDGVDGVRKVLCGKWNTFFVVERGDDG